MTNIAIIYPAISANGGWNCFNNAPNCDTHYISHGLASISANLKKNGFTNIELIDFRTLRSWAEYISIIKEKSFDVALFSYLSPDYLVGKEAIGFLKDHKKHTKVILGGLHACVSDSDDETEADYIIKGEGEEILVELLKNGFPEQRVICSESVKNIDNLPFVDRDLFPPTCELNYPIFEGLPPPHVTIVAGRGCEFVCRFCVDRRKIYGATCRIRSVANIIEELLILQSRFKWNSMMIHDDILHSPKWLNEFINEYKKHFYKKPFWIQTRADFICRNENLMKDLADVGLLWAGIGFEVGSQKMLDFLNKKTTVEQNLKSAEICKKYGIRIFANYILGGFPTETEDDIRQTAEMIIKIRPERHSRSTYTAFPGSWLYDYCKQNDLIMNENWGNHSVWEKKIKGVDYNMIQKYGQYIDSRCHG